MTVHQKSEAVKAVKAFISTEQFQKGALAAVKQKRDNLILSF